MNSPTKQSLRDFVLDDRQQQRLLNGMGSRDRALTSFLFATGARVSEALSIRNEHIRLDGNVATITVCGKGNKIRQLRVSESLLSSIRCVFQGSTFLFESANGRPLDRSYVWKRVHASAAKVGFRFSPHCARHTFATTKIAETGKIKAVSRYLGHSSPSITMSMYVHESLSDEDLGLPKEGGL